MPTDDRRQIETVADALWGLPQTILDRPLVTMVQIRVQARAMQRKGRCGMVIFDTPTFSERATYVSLRPPPCN